MFLGCEILQRMPHPNNQDTQGLVLPIEGIIRCNLNFWFNIDFWINHCLINQLLLFVGWWVSETKSKRHFLNSFFKFVLITFKMLVFVVHVNSKSSMKFKIFSFHSSLFLWTFLMACLSEIIQRWSYCPHVLTSLSIGNVYSHIVYLYACFCSRLSNSDWKWNTSSDDSFLGFYSVCYITFVWVFWRNMLPLSVGMLILVQMGG